MNNTSWDATVTGVTGKELLNQIILNEWVGTLINWLLEYSIIETKKLIEDCGTRIPMYANHNSHSAIVYLLAVERQRIKRKEIVVGIIT